MDEYIEKKKSPQKEILKKLRKIIQESAPNSQEAMSYGVPAFKLNKEDIILFAAFKEHVGIYPKPSAIVAFKDELTKYRTSKGTIQFSLDKPIPYSLVKKIVEFRIKEIIKKQSTR